MSQWYVFIKYSFADNEMHQPASEKAKVETKLRFHAGRLDAGVGRLFLFEFYFIDCFCRIS